MRHFDGIYLFCKEMSTGMYRVFLDNVVAQTELMCESSFTLTIEGGRF